MDTSRTLRVLLYHHVHDGADGSFRVTTAKFRRQMEALLAQWYVPVTLERVLAARRGEPLPANAVLVTFDDAYEDVILHAHPILRDLEIPATLFVITDAIGGTNKWDAGMPSHRHLDADQIRRLANEGWSIGSHSRSHPVLTGLGDHTIDEELRESQTTLERLLDAPVRGFAYPGGHRDARVKAAVARHYDLGFSTDVFGPYPPGDAFDLSRFDPSFCGDIRGFLEGLAACAIAPPQP